MLRRGFIHNRNRLQRPTGTPDRPFVLKHLQERRFGCISAVGTAPGPLKQRHQQRTARIGIDLNELRGFATDMEVKGQADSRWHRHNACPLSGCNSRQIRRRSY